MEIFSKIMMDYHSLVSTIANYMFLTSYMFPTNYYASLNLYEEGISRYWMTTIF